jgi:hypothetical protein
MQIGCIHPNKGCIHFVYPPQKPAHELISNEYDVTLHQKQFDLMNDTYTAIRAIRLFFSNHPLAKDVKIPEHVCCKLDLPGIAG